jgi:hypothetical protein
MNKVRLSCQWELHFFGLNPEDKDLYLEQIFILVYHLGFTYNDAYKLPVWERVWFIQRLKKEFETAKENNSKATSNAQRTNSGSRNVRKFL